MLVTLSSRAVVQGVVANEDAVTWAEMRSLYSATSYPAQRPEYFPLEVTNRSGILAGPAKCHFPPRCRSDNKTVRPSSLEHNSQDASHVFMLPASQDLLWPEPLMQLDGLRFVALGKQPAARASEKSWLSHQPWRRPILLFYR